MASSMREIWDEAGKSDKSPIIRTRDMNAGIAPTDRIALIAFLVTLLVYEYEIVPYDIGTY